MENDTISREAVIDAIRFGISNIRAFNDTTMVRFYERENEALEKAIDRVNELPSVQPSRKGHWIEHKGYGSADYGIEYSCSNCNEWVKEKSKFCPNCGAEMTDDVTITQPWG